MRRLNKKAKFRGQGRRWRYQRDGLPRRQQHSVITLWIDRRPVRWCTRCGATIKSWRKAGGCDGRRPGLHTPRDLGFVEGQPGLRLVECAGSAVIARVNQLLLDRLARYASASTGRAANRAIIVTVARELLDDGGPDPVAVLLRVMGEGLEGTSYHFLVRLALHLEEEASLFTAMAKTVDHDDAVREQEQRLAKAKARAHLQPKVTFTCD